MKLNWGYSILIVIIVFVSGIGLLVYISFQQKVNLVHKDYYPMEIAHQTMIDKEINLRELKVRLNIEVFDGIIQIQFPELFYNSGINGEILIFRPSDYEEDRIVEILVDSVGIQNIPTASLLKGKYLVKVDWICDSVGYFQQQEIFINN